MARPAVMVVARAKDSAATTEGYHSNGGGGDEDNSRSNSGKNGEHSSISVLMDMPKCKPRAEPRAKPRAPHVCHKSHGGQSH